jgi:hypothetical protein
VTGRENFNGVEHFEDHQDLLGKSGGRARSPAGETQPSRQRIRRASISAGAIWDDLLLRNDRWLGHDERAHISLRKGGGTMQLEVVDTLEIVPT